ncbi:MAG: CYTH domain-containing protein [Rubrivivax sp.]|nr:CYTH domain-containing protein [Rubrivivax sp.]
MALEIERKFVIDQAAWVPQGSGVRFRQGYLSSNKERVVRVRIEGQSAKLTIKGATIGVTRSEFEYSIPLEDAAILLDRLCEQPLIDKHRHTEVHFGKTWEIDVFHGPNEGLVLAELELATEDEEFQRPVWVLAEVSGDARYFNSNLVKNPYSNWKKG